MNDFPYGGFWRRSMAFSTDKLILQILSLIVYYIGARIMSPGYGIIDISSPYFYTLLWSYYGVALVLDMVYFTYFHGVSGQTPGKRLFGLRVIQVSGAPMTMGTAFLRWVGYLISKIFIYLGFIWIAFSKRKRGWHDMIAGTYVVRTGRSVETAPGVPEGTGPFGPTFDSSAPLASSRTAVDAGTSVNIKHMSKILDKRRQIG